MFKITVTEVTEKKVSVPNDNWQVVEKGYDDGKGELRDRMGYPPPIERTVKDERIVLSHEVERIDLPSIVNAVFQHDHPAKQDGGVKK